MEVAEFVGPLLQKSTYVCVGSTKAFRTKLERVIRVVAKLMAPFEICHEVSSAGVERCYVNGLYALVTQDGEFHYPKDNQRRELGVSATEQKSLRQGVMTDMTEMGRAGQPLSPKWWRQLGDENQALLAEKRLIASPSRGSSRKTRGEPAMTHYRRVSKESFEVDAIVSEKKGCGKGKTVYLVRWAGYDVSWEPWRINGQPGDPIETWEPVERLRGTEALENWRTRTSS